MRKIFSKSGEPLTRKLVVKIFDLGNRKFKTNIIQSKPGHGMTEDYINQQLETITTAVDRAYPGEEFELKDLGRGQFNIVHIGSKPNWMEVDSIMDELSDGSSAKTTVNLRCGHSLEVEKEVAQRLTLRHKVLCEVCEAGNASQQEA